MHHTFLMALGVQKEKKDIFHKAAGQKNRSLQIISRHSMWLTPSRDNMVLQC